MLVYYHPTASGESGMGEEARMARGQLKALMTGTGLRLGHYVGEFVTPGIGYMLREAGCAFCFLDMEHSGMSFDTLAAVLRFMEAADLATMVRVPSHSSDHIARALDLASQRRQALREQRGQPLADDAGLGTR